MRFSSSRLFLYLNKKTSPRTHDVKKKHRNSTNRYPKWPYLKPESAFPFGPSFLGVPPLVDSGTFNSPSHLHEIKHLSYDLRSLTFPEWKASQLLRRILGVNMVQPPDEDPLGHHLFQTGWVVESPTHLQKYESKWVHLPQIGLKINNVWNHWSCRLHRVGAVTRRQSIVSLVLWALHGIADTN